MAVLQRSVGTACKLGDRKARLTTLAPTFAEATRRSVTYGGGGHMACSFRRFCPLGSLQPLSKGATRGPTPIKLPYAADDSRARGRRGASREGAEGL